VQILDALYSMLVAQWHFIVRIVLARFLHLEVLGIFVQLLIWSLGESYVDVGK
jgi:hypothetical protein